MERSYTPNKELKVLYSPGYGSGWSTWNNHDMALATDARIIKYYEQYHDTSSEDDVAEFLASIKYPDVYCGGWKQLKIAYIPSGFWFRIIEYDGSESIEILNPTEWRLA